MPDVRDVTAAEIKAVDGGFRVAFDDADPVTARKVVVATGVLPYAHIPAELSGLPPDLVMHTSDPSITNWTVSGGAGSPLSAPASPRSRRRRCCTRQEPTSRSSRGFRRSPGSTPTRPR